jgi:hypothetical protein
MSEIVIIISEKNIAVIMQAFERISGAVEVKHGFSEILVAAQQVNCRLSGNFPIEKSCRKIIYQ